MPHDSLWLSHSTNLCPAVFLSSPPLHCLSARLQFPGKVRSGVTSTKREVMEPEAGQDHGQRRGFPSVPRGVTHKCNFVLDAHLGFCKLSSLSMDKGCSEPLSPLMTFCNTISKPVAKFCWNPFRFARLHLENFSRCHFDPNWKKFHR